MRIIDRKWIDLATGYRTVLSLSAQLENEFGRAVQVGHEQKFQKDIVEWKRKRRIFFALVAIAPLSVIGLCLAAYYYREVACVIIYWILLVVIILVTLAFVGRTYIRDVMNRPELRAKKNTSFDLEQRWWAGLTPTDLVQQLKSGNAAVHFLSLMADLPNTFLGAQGDPLETDPSVYVFAPSGPWIFTLRDWSGDIVRQGGQWKELRSRGRTVIIDDAPDDQWYLLKQRMARILSEHFPQTTGQIQGGVAFTNSKVHILKDQIEGNAAAVGQASAWIGRMSAAPEEPDLTLDMQLKTLDALLALERPADRDSATIASAKELANRLYQENATELRQYVAGMLK